MFNYLQQLKEICDSLTAAGVSVSDHNLIAAALAKLLDDFGSFIDLIMLHLLSTSFDELHGLLLTNELFMTRKKKKHIPTPPHAFAAQNQPL